MVVRLSSSPSPARTSSSPVSTEFASPFSWPFPPCSIFSMSDSSRSLSCRCFSNSEVVEARSSLARWSDASSSPCRICAKLALEALPIKESTPTRNLVNSSRMRLFLVAKRASSELAGCAFAFDAFGLGSCRPRWLSEEIPSSSSRSPSRPANSTYYRRHEPRRIQNTIYHYLHNLKLPLYFVVVSIALEQLPQLFYLSCLLDMTSASVSRKPGDLHTWLEASLACSSDNLRALVSATVTTVLCALRDCDRRSTSDSRDVTWDSRSLTL